MTLTRPSSVVAPGGHDPDGDAAVTATETRDTAPPARLLDIIPVPEIDRYMVIIAHLVPASVPASSTVTGPDTGEPPREGQRPAGGHDGLRVDRDARRVWVDGREI